MNFIIHAILKDTVGNIS